MSYMLVTLGARGRKTNITFSDLQHWDKCVIIDESRDGNFYGANVV